MKFEDWQTKQNLSNTALAELLHVHPSLITHIKKGRRNWTPRMAEAMEILSDGEVPRLQLLYPNHIKKQSFVHRIKTLFPWGKPPKT